MSLSALFALIALVAFGFVFKFISVEERRNFFRVLVALLMVFGLVSYFVRPLVHHPDIQQLLDFTAIVSFVLAVLFLLAYLKLDQRLRLEQEELNGNKKGRRKK